MVTVCTSSDLAARFFLKLVSLLHEEMFCLITCNAMKSIAIARSVAIHVMRYNVFHNMEKWGSISFSCKLQLKFAGETNCKEECNLNGVLLQIVKRIALRSSTFIVKGASYII